MDGNLLHVEDVDRIKGCGAVFAKGKALPQRKGQCEGKSLCGFSPCVPLLPHKKRHPIGAALIKQHRNVLGKRRSFGYAVSPFCRSASKDAGSIPTRS